VSFPLTPQRIAAILRCPERNVIENWPLIENALESLGMADDPVKVAALATVAVETARTFVPIQERGSVAYFAKMYEGAARLGNTEAGDGVRFRGRGFVQITGRANYQDYGQRLGIDLLVNPDAALEPVTSAAILAMYFQRRGMDIAAHDADWVKCRRIVNGGTNGLDDFLAHVHALLNAMTV